MNILKKKFNKFLSILLLKIFGWNIKGTIPKNLKKYIVIGAPHKSNWDLFFGILWAYKNELPIKYIIKIEAMRFPLNILLNMLGAIPIIRNHQNPNKSNTKKIIDIVNNRKQIVLAISPEGTRKNINTWKTGFYHIAEGTNLPILPVYIDYKKKTVGTYDLFYITNDKEKDIKFLRNLYNPLE